MTARKTHAGGERQRLNFARLLLHKPKVIGLDEATSSLPRKDGLALYHLLIQRLPQSILISTVHRRELLALHTLEGSLKKGQWNLAPIRGLKSSAPEGSLATPLA